MFNHYRKNTSMGVTRFTIPLLKDHHNHPGLYSSLQNCVDLRFVKTAHEALGILHRQPCNKVIVAIGHNDSIVHLTRDDLDTLPPVVVVNASLHSFLINSKAEQILSDTCGVVVQKRNDNAWREKNFPLLIKFIAHLNALTQQQLQDFFDQLLQKGIWFAEELLLVNEKEIDLLQESNLIERTRIWTDLEGYHALDPVKKRYIYGIKAYVDGALGCRTAALKIPYLTGEQGMLNYTPDELLHYVNEIAAVDKPMAIHAIGDEAVENVIDTIAAVKRRRNSLPDVRIEHCQFISESYIKAARTCGIHLSMQPNFNSDTLYYKDRLPHNYCMMNNPFRVLIDKGGFTPGKDLFLGSDGMPHGALYALQEALFPPCETQRLSIDEFVAGYCMPDMQQGYIDVTIDEKKATVVSCTVRGV